MRTQTLILGITLGGVVLAATAVIAQRRSVEARGERPAPEVEPEPARPPAATAAETMVAPDLAAPPDLLPPDDSGTAARSAVPGEPIGIPSNSRLAGLLEELREAHALGLVSDERLAAFLAQIYIENGQGRRAMRLLERHSSQDTIAWSSLALALESAGDVAGQKEALLAALALDPWNEDILESLGRIDPGLVVRKLAQQLAEQPAPGDPDLRARLAQMLLRNGQGREARAMIEGLLVENPGDQQAIMLLAKLDPARAIEFVEGQLAHISDPAEMRYLLVNLLTDAGNAAGAEAVLERLAREGQPVGSSEWGRIGQFWLESGEKARGVSALQRALVNEHGDPDEWVHMLEEFAPRELLLALEQRVAGDERRNDEYWGSLADSYWAAGRPADARAAWEQARALDAEDGEWPGRLRALDQGRDPFE